MKKKINIILIIVMLLSGCSIDNSSNKKNPKVEVDNTRVKEIYNEYITTHWEDGFYEGEDEQYGIDEFALLDINNDSVLDLIVKNNELNAFGIVTVLDEEILKVPFFSASTVYQENLDVLDEKIEDKYSFDYIEINDEKHKFYYRYSFPLNDIGKIFLVNNEFISIPYMYDMNDWERSYGYGYFFTFKQGKDAFDFKGALEIKNGKITDKHYRLYDVRKKVYENENENFYKAFNCIPYCLDLNIYDKDYGISGSLNELESSLLDDIHLTYYDNDDESIIWREYKDNNGNEIDVGSRLYYNLDTGTKGKNIKSVKEIKFHEYRMDNIVKYFS